MLMRTQADGDQRSLVLAAGSIAGIGAAALIGAWIFQYGLGLAPCPLCLEQRWPYYLAVPLALAVTIAAVRGAPRWALIGGLVLITLLMLWGAGLGIYHSGVEWKWWPGPQDCAGGGGLTSGRAGDLLRRMQTARVVRCDEAAWRDPITGLSLAGWNVVISVALIALALRGIRATLKGPGAAPPGA